VHLVTLADALAGQGRLAEAAQACERGHELATASRAGSLGFWFPLTRGFLELSRGRPREAIGQFRIALAETRGVADRDATVPDGTATPPGGVDTQGALAGIVLAGALVDEPDPVAYAAIARACDAADAAGEDGTATPEYAIMQRALAWVAARAGDLTGARERLARMAGICRSLGRRGHELQVLSDLVRLGGTGEVLDRVVELTADSTLPLGRARNMVARATRARAPGDLVAAAEAFAALGADLIAAEVYASAARLWHADGDGRAAARATARSGELAALCEGARTPGLLPPEAVGPLSPREREIALLAARGVPSKEIAEKLYLSVRTVNNHLQSVYSKLGVSARAELAEALGTATPTKGRET
jgi:DNA-binding NarL/FixJ family response regulator